MTRPVDKIEEYERIWELSEKIYVQYIVNPKLLAKDAVLYCYKLALEFETQRKKSLEEERAKLNKG